MSSNDDNTRTHVVLTKGTMVSHYRIDSKIGAGGMGDVYLADDTELDRKVALKFLPSHLCGDEDCRTRFKREAQAAAKLNHPNIITIHEVGDFQNRPFFVMEHVEGRSLRDIKNEELDIDRIVGMAIQLCDGLQTAHRANITHRDIKPSNIVIDSTGRPKLLDFGLALVKGSQHLTKTGSTLGTIGYMSPEQIEGKETDARSDLFSLGCVLYEMIAGQSPFRRNDETATLKAILQDNPEPLSRYKSDVPDDLQRIVTKLLEKDPALRYQSAAGVIPDLKRLSPSRTSRVLVEKKSDWWNRYVVPSAVVVMLAALGFWYLGDRNRTQDTSSINERKMLAVLPFENLGGPEDENFADGITDAITSRLAKISGLGVIARTSVLQYKGTTKRIQEIGAELGVGYVLEGTILWDKSGDTTRVRIIPQLIEVADESHLWTETYERALTQIFSLQADIATSIADKLNVNLLQPEREALAERPTDNMEAYQAFLAGETAEAGQEDTLAIRMYEQAIDLDPDFALAYARLSTSHSWLYHSYIDHTESRLQQAKNTIDVALKLQPDLPESHLALGFYHYWGHRQYDEALTEFAIAEKGMPNNPRILQAVAGVWRRQGRFEEAQVKFETAFQLNPRDDRSAFVVAMNLAWLRNYEDALSYADQAILLKPDLPLYYAVKTVTFILMGDLRSARRILENTQDYPDLWMVWVLLEMLDRNYEAALEHLAEAKEEVFLAGGALACVSQWRGNIYRFMGEDELSRIAMDSARTFLESHREEYQDYFGYHTSLGEAYAHLGQKEKAIMMAQSAAAKYPISRDALLGTCQLRDNAYVYVAVGAYDTAIDLLEQVMSTPFDEESVSTLRLNPQWDPLRDHPRFQALIEKYDDNSGR